MPSKVALQRLLDGLQLFMREHLALARSEIKSDLRAIGRDLAVGAAGVPALAVGYLLLMLAISALLALVLPAWAAYGIVALLNLGGGGALTLTGIRRIRREQVELPRTAEEIERDRKWLASGMKPGAPRDGLQPPGTPH